MCKVWLKPCRPALQFRAYDRVVEASARRLGLAAEGLESVKLFVCMTKERSKFYGLKGISRERSVAVIDATRPKAWANEMPCATYLLLHITIIDNIDS